MSPCPAQETKADALTWCPGQRRIRGARVEAEGPRHPGSSPTPPAFSVSCGQQAALTLSNQPYREETGTASTTDLAPPGRLWPLKKICLKCRATERRQSELSSPSLLPKRLSQDEARSLGAPTRLSLTGLGPKHWVLELELIQTLRDPALPCTATVGSSCKDSEPVCPLKALLSALVPGLACHQDSRWALVRVLVAPFPIQLPVCGLKAAPNSTLAVMAI